MNTLYKKENNNLKFIQFWDDSNGSTVLNYGDVGIEGEYKEFKNNKDGLMSLKVENIIEQKISEGYSVFDEENFPRLIVEHKVEGMGNTNDLDKRYRLESLLKELLGWTGLGDCDGGSMGSGSMEVCCFVVDYEIAKKVVEEKLKDTEFADYSRIYLEE